MADLQINDRLVIPEAVLHIQSSRSSGPGGQNVNKLNTRVTVVCDIFDCPTLTDVQKRRITQKLANRADKDGCLHISSQRYRSQHANRLDALERLAALIADAVKPPVKRRKTKIPKSAVEKRLRAKKHRAASKYLRSHPADD